jgi:hypothetical protein
MQRETSSLLFRGALPENVQDDKFEVAILPPTPTPKETQKGSEIKPRIDGHRSTPVSLPNIQEEVKPDKHLGDMSVVKTVRMEKREGVCPKSNGGNSALELKLPEKPRNPQQDNDNGDMHMDYGTEEDEK